MLKGLFILVKQSIVFFVVMGILAFANFETITILVGAYIISVMYGLVEIFKKY